MSAVNSRSLGMSRRLSPVAIGILCTALVAAVADIAGYQDRQRNVDDTGAASKREPFIDVDQRGARE